MRDTFKFTFRLYSQNSSSRTKIYVDKYDDNKKSYLLS